MSRQRRLRRAELPPDTLALAGFLLGKLLIREAPEGRTAGRIVETEAYHERDRASHTFGGRTARNAVMFGQRGCAYVYFSYGMHWCVNVTSEEPGVGAAVLIRALEPLEGIAIMRSRRGHVRDGDLARGPGRLTRALAIDSSYNGSDLCARGATLWLADDGYVTARVERGPRIGITRDAHLPWRYFIPGNRFVSGPRRAEGADRKGGQLRQTP